MPASARTEPPGEYPAPADIIQAHAEALSISLRAAQFHVLHRDHLEAACMRPRVASGADHPPVRMAAPPRVDVPALARLLLPDGVARLIEAGLLPEDFRP
jgi:hypothetical protein